MLRSRARHLESSGIRCDDAPSAVSDRDANFGRPASWFGHPSIKCSCAISPENAFLHVPSHAPATTSAPYPQSSGSQPYESGSSASIMLTEIERTMSAPCTLGLAAGVSEFATARRRCPHGCDAAASVFRRRGEDDDGGCRQWDFRYHGIPPLVQPAAAWRQRSVMRAPGKEQRT